MSTLKVAAHLRAIADMAQRLEARAMDLANSPLFPGGDAMVNLAHVANLDTWLRRNDLSGDELAAIEDPDELWSPFQLLAYWSEGWRTELGMDHDDPSWRPIIATEAAFLANADVLAWAWDNEPHFEEFAADVATAKTRLEAILREGERADRIRVICPDCDAGKRLVVRYGPSEDRDSWKCPACKHRFDADAVRRAWESQMRSVDAQRWVPLVDAVSILRTLGWRDATIRGWADSEQVDTRLTPAGRSVYWPDMWRAHLAHRQERDNAKREQRDRLRRKAACIADHREGCWDHDGKRRPGQPGCARAGA